MVVGGPCPSQRPPAGDSSIQPGSRRRKRAEQGPENHPDEESPSDSAAGGRTTGKVTATQSAASASLGVGRIIGPGAAEAANSISWDELDARDKQYLVSTVVRFLLARECARTPVSKREVTVLLAETLGVQPSQSGRYPAFFNALRNKVLEHAARYMLFDLGFRILQVGRLPLGEHSRSRARHTSRGLTLKMAPYHFYQERGLIEAEPPTEQGGGTGDSVPNDALLLVSDLPSSLRAEPSDAAFVGFITVLACLFGLSETGTIGERSLFAILTGLGFQGLHSSAEQTDTATGTGHPQRQEEGALVFPTATVPEEPNPPVGSFNLEGANWFLRHRYCGDVQKLVTQHLLKMLYLQRFRLSVGDTEWTYAAGPRLRAELPPAALFHLLCDFFGDDAVDGARVDLQRRLLPHGDASLLSAACSQETSVPSYERASASSQ
ncbi:hypothetical protein CCYA_CCYA02G0790 [Cyanidiococcus yangmingshanensis]|nr:hypothetical protein CCYA_CCYA02G0790 [Cyanidiococcus yangmingshanensis]